MALPGRSPTGLPCTITPTPCSAIAVETRRGIEQARDGAVATCHRERDILLPSTTQGGKWNMRTILALSISCCSLCLGNFAVSAEPTPEAQMLSQEIASQVPPNWQIHVSWRENQLVAFVTPTYQEGFDLWYEPQKLRAAMLKLCPGRDDPLWVRLSSGKQIAVQPTVGGKSDDSMRLTCQH